MTAFDQQRVAKWIRDAFSILCMRVGGGSAAERRLRLGFEAILRQLGTSPLGLIMHSAPLSPRPSGATLADLRQIIRALDSCLLVFQRYGTVLTPPQRRVDELVRAARQHADEELRARQSRTESAASFAQPC